MKAWTAFLIIFFLTSVITGGIASYFGNMRTINILTGMKYKCYYDLLYSIADLSLIKWATAHNKAEELANWLVKTLDKIGYSDTPSDIEFTEYLCRMVGIPTDLFGIVQFIGFIILMRAYTVVRVLSYYIASFSQFSEASQI